MDRNKKLEYFKKIKDKQREEYFSPENVKKRKEKAIQYQKNSNKKRQNLKKFSDKMIILHKEDAIFYEEIWKLRPHYCENCGKFLGNNFKNRKGQIILYRYAHIIFKSIYPYLRHYDKNIMLLCLDCHTKFDQSQREIVEKMNCYDKEHIEDLKELHKKLEQENNTIYR